MAVADALPVTEKRTRAIAVSNLPIYSGSKTGDP